MRINLSNERIGLKGKNNFGSIMEIVEYNDCINIYVKFENSKPIHTTMQSFRQGKVKNPYDRTVYEIGYIGEGKYKSSINNKPTKECHTWRSMLERCYSKKYHQKYPTYKDCTVAEEWHNFQNFAQWYDENYYEVKGQRMELDKDVLVKGNKVYSPETCIFVPHSINVLFIKNDANRGIFPVGVDFINNKYRSICQRIFLGYYNTSEEAFQSYKIYKEKLIKRKAIEFKNKIPEKLYDALLSYDVEMTD